jgi:REP element-mobilizing transposase RayT
MMSLLGMSIADLASEGWSAVLQASRKTLARVDEANGCQGDYAFLECTAVKGQGSFSCSQDEAWSAGRGGFEWQQCRDADGMLSRLISAHATMARQPRLDLPGIPQHVVQRGNDRQACFAADVDYGQYLQELREAALKHDCAVHAFVLMSRHVHLLVTPSGAGAISRMMQAVGRRCVGSFNARQRSNFHCLPGNAGERPQP